MNQSSNPDEIRMTVPADEAVMNVIQHGLSEEDGKPTFEIAFSISTPRGICIRILEKECFPRNHTLCSVS